MTDQPVDPAVPADPSLPNEPMTSVQSQLGLLLAAIAALIAFIFHKDFSSIVPAISTLAFAVYGASVAIARAVKHRTVVQAQVALHSIKVDASLAPASHDEVQAAFDAVSRHNAEQDRKLRALEDLANEAQRPAAARKTARTSPRTRKTATAR